MPKKPANHDKNTGRFTPGNKAATGWSNAAKKSAELRAALYQAVTAQDIAAIAQNLKAQAVSGDLRAISLLLDRLLGTAGQGIDLIERIENLEQLLEDGKNGND